jgi:DNA-binding phage protein
MDEKPKTQLKHTRLDSRHAVKRTKLSSGQKVKAPKRGELNRFLPALGKEEKQDVVAEAIHALIHSDLGIPDIAEKHGVSRGTIYNWMLGELGPSKYQDLVTRALVARVRRADELLEAASDPLNIARAREMARFARMDLERRRPSLYGQKQEVTHVVNDLGDRLRRARERVIPNDAAAQLVATAHMASEYEPITIEQSAT